MLKKLLATAVVLGLTATAAQAFEVEGYAGLNLGQASANKSGQVARDYDDARDKRKSSSKTDNAYKLTVGLKLNPYVALEAQYADLGKAKYKRNSSHWQNKETTKTQGYGANVVGIIPIGETGVNLFAKTGLHRMSTKLAHTVVHPTESGKSKKTINKWTHNYGIGASYTFVENFEAVAEFERYRNVANKKFQTFNGDKLNFKHDINLLSVGMRYKF